MKAIASVAIAGLIAATSLTATITPADAGGKHWKHNQWSYGNHHNKHYKKQHYSKNYYTKNYYYSSKGGNAGAALAAGALLGFTFGALATPSYYYTPKVYAYTPPPPPPYAYSHGPLNAQHVSWCSFKYKSYNVKYNSWIGFDGLVHQCISPYY
jgi:hypothetical protein